MDKRMRGLAAAIAAAAMLQVRGNAEPSKNVASERVIDAFLRSEEKAVSFDISFEEIYAKSKKSGGPVRNVDKSKKGRELRSKDEPSPWKKFETDPGLEPDWLGLGPSESQNQKKNRPPLEKSVSLNPSDQLDSGEYSSVAGPVVNGIQAVYIVPKFAVLRSKKHK